ncbi:hypothetical protein GCK72_008813 [Caenorhabditis remanei]|uniref:Uncharacterized protein n=1 Tax=Caenorhabditis remanei TaxID=31234 RepID=A0A6A5H1C1_CAERE|nr:hypothetical protein GCK72_008813 [Caenorhabditis remanei]KAF1760564.1 hypothetical protein GCK72_008813 [Caenorhabditis remanei]
MVNKTPSSSTIDIKAATNTLILVICVSIGLCCLISFVAILITVLITRKKKPQPVAKNSSPGSIMVRSPVEARNSVEKMNNGISSGAPKGEEEGIGA